MNNLEHPDITSALNTGYPSGYDDTPTVCPVCGSEDCDTIYIERETHTAIGCDQCLMAFEPWDYYANIAPVYS